MSKLNELSDLIYQMSAVATNTEEAREINDICLRCQELLIDIVKELKG